MIVIHLFLVAVFLFVVPIILGSWWVTLLPKKNRYRILACFPVGFFIELAVFQLIVVPMTFLHLPFTIMCWLFIGVVLFGCVYSIRMLIQKPVFSLSIPHYGKWEVFYLIVFLTLLGVQLYNGIIRDTTYWSYDDAAYVTYAADAIRMNAIQTIDPYTGIATTFTAYRALQGWLYYPAFLSAISSMPVTVIERTVLETYDILLAYIVYAYMSSVIFKKKVDGLIFLILLSVLHVFGWYSQYSVTFRLLGPNYQGKAVLAVSFFPLLFTILIQLLEKAFRKKVCYLLMLFSAAASSFTLFGAVTMIMNTSLVVGLSFFRKERRWEHLQYILWGSLLPVLYCGIYFLYKYGQY